MDDITEQIKKRRSDDALLKIDLMIKNCKSHDHLNVIKRYLYLYRNMFGKGGKYDYYLSLYVKLKEKIKC
jgi:hypothetical protein